MNRATNITLDDLWGEVPDGLLPPLDRAGSPPEMGTPAFNWWLTGLVIVPKLIPHDLIDAYVNACPPGQWGIGTPYLQSVELRDVALYPPLMSLLFDLFGEPMGLHLNLTYWRSTRRQWHQDAYLNPPQVGGYYAATWIALDDIHPDSGPFEYVPGTHRWPAIQRDRMLAALGEDGSNPDWPWRSEQLLTPLFEERFAAEGRAPEQFVAEKGDVLVWHSRLAHRGSEPRDPSLERRALISHYSGVFHRSDFTARRRHNSEGWYFLP